MAFAGPVASGCRSASGCEPIVIDENEENYKQGYARG